MSGSSPNWRDDADCRGKDLRLFFEAYETDSEIAQDVDDLCRGCPVRDECLKMGIETAGTGVHGGAYLILGQLSRAKNAHKPAEEITYLQQQIDKLRGIR